MWKNTNTLFFAAGAAETAALAASLMAAGFYTSALSSSLGSLIKRDSLMWRRLTDQALRDDMHIV